MDSQLTIREPAPPAASPVAALLADPERLKDYPIDVIERMFALDREMRAEAAEREFLAAMARVKAAVTPVAKRGRIPNKRGDTIAHYAYVKDVTDMLDPILAANGLRRWATEEPSDTEGHVRHVLVLAHDGGHKERFYLTAPIQGGKGGTMNAMQGVVSTGSYAERILLCRACAVVLVDDDQDGADAHAADTITQEQAADLEALCEEVGGNKGRLLAIFKVDSFETMTNGDRKAALAMLEQRRARQ